MLIEPVPYHPVPKNSFLALSLTLEKMSDETDTEKKEVLLKTYLSQLDNDHDLKLAVRFIFNDELTNNAKRRPGIGARTLGLLVASFCEINYDIVFKPSKKAMGSTNETIQKLMENIPEARSKRNPEPIPLAMIGQIIMDLAQIRNRKEKQRMLSDIWQRMTGIEIKYLLNIIRYRALETGLDSAQVLSTLASLYDVDYEAIRYTRTITGDWGKTAYLARNKQLGNARFNLYHPLSYMYPKSYDQFVVPLNDYYIEEKIDGVRCQVHTGLSGTRLYSGKRVDITKKFPDVVQFFDRKNCSDMVLDGVLCVFSNDMIQPSPYLKKRMEAKKITKQILINYPVIFIAFDIIYYRNEITFKTPLIRRRQLLERICKTNRLFLTNRFEFENEQNLEGLFQQSLTHGNTGLILKKKESIYNYGKRCESWLKWEQKPQPLKSILMYAHTVNGRDGKYLSGFTLGIRVDDDDRYEDVVIPIGKTKCRGSENDMKLLGKRINEIIVDRFGPTLALKPEIVVEIEYEKILVNKKTKANYILQSPGIKTILWDNSSGDVSTLKDVEYRYQQNLQAKRKKQGKASSIIFPELMENQTD